MTFIETWHETPWLGFGSGYWLSQLIIDGHVIYEARA